MSDVLVTFIDRLLCKLRLHRWETGSKPSPSGRPLPVLRCARPGCTYWKAPWA